MNLRTDNAADRFSLQRLRHRLAKPLCLVFSAAALALSIGWPFTVWITRGTTSWWLELCALAVLVYQCEAIPAPGRVGRQVWIFATVWLAGTFWWLFIAMHVYGGAAALLAAVAVCVLAAVLASYYAAACYFYKRYVPESIWAKASLFCAMWTLAEMARSLWLTGFGWGAIGYAHGDGPLAVLLPYVGVFGVTAAAAWISAFAAVAYAKQRRRLIWVAVGLGLLYCVPSVDFTDTAGTIPVVLLQGNIPQDEKFESGSGIPMALSWYQSAWQSAQPALYVAPETAIPVLPQDLPDGYWAKLKTRFSNPDSALLTGVPLQTTQGGYINGVVGFYGADGVPYSYAKHHLVPFGEFIPPMFKWFTQLMHIPLGDFDRGALSQKSFEWAGQRLAPTICYEDLYGDELVTRFQNRGEEPTVFVNVSNLGWFGNTVVIPQHLQISRIRALEFQRPFIRATNTGATAIMDHRGRVVSELPSYSRGTLIGVVEGRTGLTPYTVWLAGFGFWPYWLTSAFAMVLAITARMRRTARERATTGNASPP